MWLEFGSEPSRVVSLCSTSLLDVGTLKRPNSIIQYIASIQDGVLIVTTILCNSEPKKCAIKGTLSFQIQANNCE